MNTSPMTLSHLLDNPLAQEVFARRRPWILALDYDGTLAPFRERRDLAYPYAGMRVVLDRLPTEGPSRFVVISGREAENVARLLDVHPAPEIWGCHGAERLTRKRLNAEPRMSPNQRQALGRVRQIVNDPDRLETKSCAVAVHWRGLTPEARTQLEADLEPKLAEIAREGDLNLCAFDGGLELRLPGHNKGEAMKTLLAENPDAVVFYLGDDATDEDAFAALQGRGVGILVAQRPRPTKASFWIKPPQEVLTLLGRFVVLNPQKRSILRAP